MYLAPILHLISVQLSNFAWCETFPNTELFLVRIQSEYRKIRTRNNSAFGHFSRVKMSSFSLKSKFLKGDVSNYDNHPSIITIKQHITKKKTNKIFSFRNVTKEETSAV